MSHLYELVHKEQYNQKIYILKLLTSIDAYILFLEQLSITETRGTFVFNDFVVKNEIITKGRVEIPLRVQGDMSQYYSEHYCYITVDEIYEIFKIFENKFCFLKHGKYLLELLRIISFTGEESLYNKFEKKDNDKTSVDKLKDILESRQEKYGDSEKCLSLISQYWSDLTGKEISQKDVCVMMAMMKLARLKNTKENGYDPDTLLDLAGYALLALDQK